MEQRPKTPLLERIRDAQERKTADQAHKSDLFRLSTDELFKKMQTAQKRLEQLEHKQTQLAESTATLKDTLNTETRRIYAQAKAGDEVPIHNQVLLKQDDAMHDASFAIEREIAETREELQAITSALVKRDGLDLEGRPESEA